MLDAAASSTRLTRPLVVSDLVAACLWILVILPPCFGFWLVAGNLAGVNPEQQQTLILVSLIALAVATLAQVIAGYRMPVFEGPAGTYMAAIAVLAVSAQGARPREITGGLLLAGVLVLLLGALGADRILRRLFTPPVVTTFLAIVVITIVPAAVGRAIGRDGSHPWGISAAWLSALVVIVVTMTGQAARRLRSFSLLGALALGTLTYIGLHGIPDSGIATASSGPSLFPWGAPTLSLAVAAPFVVAGLLASCNTIASINVMADARGEGPRHGSERRALVVHGVAQALMACIGNVLGNVPRLDSVGAVRMIGNPRPQALGLAAALILALAFVHPAVRALAQLPVAVSAALLVVVLAMLLAQGARQLATFHWSRRWLVFAPAVAPAIAWLPFADQLSGPVQLLTNPLLVGVVLAIALDRLVPEEPAWGARAPRPHPDRRKEP